MDEAAQRRTRRLREFLAHGEPDADAFRRAWLDAPYGLVLVDDAQHVVFRNPAFDRLVGDRPETASPADEWLGASTETVPLTVADWALDAAVRGEPTRSDDLQLSVGGVLRVARFSTSAVRNGAGRIVGALLTVVDVTRERIAEERIQQLSDVALQLSSAATRDEVCRVVLQETIRALGATAGGIMLVDEAGTGLELAGALGYDPAVLQAYSQVPLSRDVPAACAVRDATPYYVRSVAEWNAQFEPLPAASTTRSAAAVPLRVLGRTSGVLTLSFARERDFGTDERRFIETLALECARALERTRLYAYEAAARREAEAASEAKDRFIATLSHELRTPLNAIVGWTALLRSGEIGERLPRAVEAIERNARMQQRLLEDMLDISRIVSGKLQLHVQDVDLAALIDLALESVTASAAAKQIAIERDLDRTTPPVRGDAARLQQVVWNVLLNAVKFTPVNGHVHVRLRRYGAQAEVVIRDDGEGIRPELLTAIFERFRQADDSTTRRHGGLGLGLAIARHLLELHGGTIRAHSDGPGRGTEVCITLPVAVASPLGDGVAPARDVLGQPS